MPRQRQLLQAGALYVLVYFVATTALPLPAEPALRLLLAGLFLFLPTLLAFVLTSRAFRASRGLERAFWGLLATAALAHALSQIGYVVDRALLGGRTRLGQVAQLGDYSYFLLVTVALLVRPHRPRSPRAMRAEALEWLMALASGYFLLFYLVLLPARGGLGVSPVLYALIEATPALLALILASRVRSGPFRRVYVLLAVGLGAAALAGLLAAWAYGRARRGVYHPLDLAWVLALLTLAAAALAPRGPAWVRRALPPRLARPPAWLALLAVATPPLLDIAFRLQGVHPALASSRSQLAVGAAGLLALLVALRIQAGSRSYVPTATPVDTPEARRAAGEPSEMLQFASGVAHELNNPLMAITGWTELALRHATAPSEGLEGLLAAARRTAEAVARLQRLARLERDERRDTV